MLLFKALIALISSPLACVQLRGPGAVGCPQPGNQEELHPWGGGRGGGGGNGAAGTGEGREGQL